MRIIDISQPVFEGMPIYPGTAETKIKSVRSSVSGSALSELQISSHMGTHIDAPSHADPAGKTLNQLGLEAFYGPARVLDMSAAEESIRVHDLEEKGVMHGERLLFKTKNSSRPDETFFDDYVYLAPDAAEYLAQLGVRLVGIDALSIKKRGEKDNTSHTALLSRDIPILEGLKLNGVKEGEYTLCAFPLALQADGAPARAVLIK